MEGVEGNYVGVDGGVYAGGRCLKTVSIGRRMPRPMCVVRSRISKHVAFNKDRHSSTCKKHAQLVYTLQNYAQVLVCAA